jgi:hypothetical protein
LHTAKALWDTGASNSCITADFAQKLKLSPFSVVEIQHAGGKSNSGVYKVNIGLPNNIIMPMMNVTECQSVAGQFDMIIGMDIITRGDFAVTNLGGKTMVSFRVPSSVSIDFNDGETIIKQREEIKDITASKDGTEIHIPNNYPRNLQCPCKSGKKYKHCHGA